MRLPESRNAGHPEAAGRRRSRRVGGYGVPLFVALLLLAGCATPSAIGRADRPFRFDRDSFAFANALLWDYAFDARGHWRGTARVPRPQYTHHCFVVARSVKQFFLHARFDPRQPVADAATYRRLIRSVVRADPRRGAAADARVVIPGYADLRAFSAGQEALLKAECGPFWQSYFQRGHWRMVFPFSRRHQAGVAGRLEAAATEGTPVVVHLVRFPSLRINHAVVVYGAAVGDHFVEFFTYDPNFPEGPTTLTYDRVTRTFSFPVNAYFPGGRVDAYDVYRNGCY